MYQDLSGTKKYDFRYNKSGEYHNDPPQDSPIRRKSVKKLSGYGTICPSCGISRSRSNKCECNS